jgi:ribosomal protein S26
MSDLGMISNWDVSSLEFPADLAETLLLRRWIITLLDVKDRFCEICGCNTRVVSARSAGNSSRMRMRYKTIPRSGF